MGLGTECTDTIHRELTEKTIRLCVPSKHLSSPMRSTARLILAAFPHEKVAILF